jgi:hypothetical protein
LRVYFYELHEGDAEIFSDLLLVHDELYEPEEFFELVQQIRRRVQDTHEDDTLIEAIAVELERGHGFTFISDDKLTVAVNVSRDEDENAIAKLDDEEEDDDDDGDDDLDADFLTIEAKLEPTNGGGQPN